MSRADYEIFSGKWKKINSSNFEVGFGIFDPHNFEFQEFDAKNPGLAINNEDIQIECILGDNGYECNVTVDGKLSFTQNFKYNGIAENSNDGMKYTVETSLAEVKPFLIGTFIQDC